MTPSNRDSIPQTPAHAPAESPRRNPLMIVWQRRWIIVSCLIFALAAAITYLCLATPIYEATAQVIVEQNMPRIIASDPTGAGLTTLQNYLWTQCTVLRSRDFLTTVMNEPGIRELRSFQPPSPQLDADVSRLRGMVNAVVGRRDDIISISVRSPVPEDTARIANAIVLAYTKFNDTAKRSNVREILDILKNQKVKLDRELGEKSKEMLDFKTANANFTFSSERISPTLERANRLAAALTERQLETLNAQSAHDTAKAMSADPTKARLLLETRAFKSETANMRNDMRELQQRLMGMSNHYLPNFPDLSGIQAAIKQLKSEMEVEDQKIIEAYIAELDAQVQANKRSEQQLEALLNQQREEVLQYNRLAAKYADLQQEIDRLNKLSQDVLFDRIKQLGITEDAGALNVKNVESAVADSTHPVAPKIWQTLAAALIFGGFLGTALAFARDWMDQRLHSVEEIKQILVLPVLGVVPHIAEAGTPAQRGLHLHLDPMSDVAEAYRTIRTAVYFGQSGGATKTLLITSPSPSEGKTTLASNLAIAMAQAGNKILLLDTDFRRPSQHKIFEIDKRIGLSNVLAGTTKLDEAIQSTPVAGLDVLPCGPIPANPSEILNSQTFAELLEELASAYDHVLLDSPPVVPVTDARILAASCDATVLAIRAERTTRKSAIYARDLLRSVGAHVLGVVVNDVPRRKGLYGYYYTYGDQYQYGYGPRRKALPAGAPQTAAANH